MDKQLRKSQSSLMISGIGVILFGAWTMAKIVLICIYSPQEIVSAGEAGESVPLVAVVLLMFLFFLVPDLLLRIYVGLSACAEARGKKKGYGYIVVALIMSLGLAFVVGGSLFLFVVSGNWTAASFADLIIVSIVDVTSVSALAEVVVSSIRVKKLRG